MTNMVMVQDLVTNRILMQERTKKGWAGITMPGGHLEAGESLKDSAIREVMEETGLILHQVELRGIVHWVRQENDNRFLIFLYRCRDFSGELLIDPPEGKLFWAEPDQISTLPLSLNLEYMLEVLLRDDVFEAYAPWLDGFTAPMQVL